MKTRDNLVFPLLAALLFFLLPKRPKEPTA